MGKAKTASKNNPVQRAKAKEVLYNDKKVVPALFVGLKSKYMSGQYDNGDMVTDENGNPLPWSSIAG